MDNLSVKDNIKKIRKAQNLSQAEMAAKLGLSRNAYCQIERGSTKVISEHLLKIAEILNTDVKSLILGYSGQEKEEVSVLEDEREGNYRSAVDSLKAAHKIEVERLSAEIERLNEHVAALKTHISSLDELIRSKDEIIYMLRKGNTLAEND